MTIRALPFWLDRRHRLEQAYANLPQDSRASIDSAVSNRLAHLEAIIEPEIRPGNGLEKALVRERLTLRLDEIARALDSHSAPLLPYKENADGYHPGMVFIPGGPTTIGTRHGFFSREEPERHIDVRGFWIDVHPVTNADFHELFPAHVPDDHSAEPEMPVVAVTWFDAHRYAAEVGKRLPTGEEWEKAARSPNGWLYSFAPEFDRSLANVWPAAGAATVDAYAPRPSGTYQMSGNVWEWTLDVEVHRLGNGATVLFNLARGGSWRNCAAGVRVTLSLCLDLAHRSEKVGFRCVSSI